jgi:hypothetical protein
MSDLGRTLIGFGLVIALVGVVIMLWGRLGLPRLPGDIVWRRGHVTFFFPIAASIVISLVLTLLLNLLFRRKP